MTKEEVRFQIALSCIQGVLEAKHGVLGEVAPIIAVKESFRIADEFVKQWFRGDTTDEVKEVAEKWSKEDERNLYNIIEAIKYVYDVSEGSSGSRLITWLKSFCSQPYQTAEGKSISEEILEYFNEKKDYRSRWYAWVKYVGRNHHWKPSKEQMDYLCRAVVDARKIHDASTSGYDAYFGLKSLYDDLKNNFSL